MIRSLEPQPLWNHFADLNAVPRPSKKEEKVRAFMRDFGKKLGLETFEDETGNIVIRKPATEGKEDRPKVVLQSHLDMVHQKNKGTDFDFESEGIKMFVEGDWVKAEGTTLGADNGIGVAAIMALLASKQIAHPPLEALFTIDEETGMTGAMGLQGGVLEGDILLNLDTEDDDELTIGCAGGVDITATGSYQSESTPSGTKAFEISVKGLTGGHSGMDIALGRANANKLLNRLLIEADQRHQLRVASIDAGGLRNAIPREGHALVVVPEDQENALNELVEKQQAIYQKEYATTDPELKVEISSAESPAHILPAEFQGKLLRALYACPNGVYRLSPEIAGLVQTSNNLAQVVVGEGKWKALCLTRSSVDTEKTDLAYAIRYTFELAGAEVSFGGEYPGWKPKPEADIVKLMDSLYRELFEEEPFVNAVHAGLECGILGQNYPEMDMISFGPNIRGAHSPDEKVQISSVQKFWKLLVQTLERI